MFYLWVGGGEGGGILHLGEYGLCNSVISSLGA